MDLDSHNNNKKIAISLIPSVDCNFDFPGPII